MKPLSVGLVLLFTGAALAAAWLAHQVLLLAFLGLLIGVVFSFPVDWLAQVMPRGLAVILVLLVLAGGAAGVGAMVVPTLVRQAEELRESASAGDTRRAAVAADTARRGECQENGGASQANRGQGRRGRVQGSIGPCFERDHHRAGHCTGRLPGSRARQLSARRSPSDSPAPPGAIRRDLAPRLTISSPLALGGILVSMTIMGTLTGVGLALAGVNGWFLLAVLTFLGTFVPYLGAIASTIPGLLAALAQSPHHFFLALIVYLVVHVVEGYIVDPLVMKRAVHIKPALLLFFQAVARAVFGVTGTLVATPLLVCIQEAVQYLWVERVRS